MKAVSVLYSGFMGEEAFVPLDSVGGIRESAFCLALSRARQFPGVEKVIVLGLSERDYPDIPKGQECFRLIQRDSWTRRDLLKVISLEEAGFDAVYFAWADCPFLDPQLAGTLLKRHTRYAAEYSYADGFPCGFAPELLSPGVAGILFNIDKDGDVPVERDALFTVIQKDINAFDIETEISPQDFRLKRLCLAADSRRNLLLIKRWLKAAGDLLSVKTPEREGEPSVPEEPRVPGHPGIPSASDAALLIESRPELLRTLPSFYNIQVTGACAQDCSFCPWPKIRGNTAQAGLNMLPERFALLLDKITAFSGDAVISLSLWGELGLHPRKIELVRMILERPSLSLIIESSGLGWRIEDFEALAAIAAVAPRRTGTLLPAPLSWIISLDAFDPGRYREIRGSGFTEAQAAAKELFRLFPDHTYVQALRFKGAEDDIEAFYRYWKDNGPAPGPGKNPAGHVIIQKYDHFCGALPRLQASDLSPVERQPCWHLLRDLTIALDGTALLCREDLPAAAGAWERACSQGAIPGKSGFNVFTHSLDEIWKEKGPYLEHCKGLYSGICGDCDEYYTYNF